MDEAQVKALAGWMAARLHSTGAVAVSDVEALSTGFSAETLSLHAAWEDATGEHVRRFVLRRESPEPAVYPQQAPGHGVEVGIQYRVMRALQAGTAVPLADVIGYESSSEVAGAPFFVMEFVDGTVPLVAPTYAAEGFFAEASPADRWRMIEDGVRQLAEVHSLDWRRHGLGWMLPDGQEPTALRQVDIWERYTERELAGRDLPLVAGAFEWLRREAPEHRPEEVTFNWGDPRPGNMIWRDFQCVCITDFEAASIAPFGIDLGWWLMFDRWSHEQSGASRLDGEPSREEQAAAYFDAARRPPAPTRWFEIFAAVRYCAIVVRVINRTVDRGLMPADNEYWRDNQATACLEDLLG